MRPSGPKYGANYEPLSATRGYCLETDPVRGVPCREPMGHAGDHKSMGGFPFENPRDGNHPHLRDASPEDIAAAEEILGFSDLDLELELGATHRFLPGTVNARVCAYEYPPPFLKTYCGRDADSPVHFGVCDDCGRTDGYHNPGVEH